MATAQKRRKASLGGATQKNGGRSLLRERPPEVVAGLRRGEGQATRVLKRSALAVARLEIGWNASPASLTSDSVSFEVSATARSNDARAKSPCSCRYSVGDFASASERIASAACSTPSRLVATTSWPIERAPSDATRPASTIASTLARARSASSSLTFWVFLAMSWLRSPALANSDWNGANDGAASKPAKKFLVLLITVSFLFWAAAAVLRAAVRVLRRVALVRRAAVFGVAFSAAAWRLARRAVVARAFLAVSALDLATFA